jgi:putative flippase GtrA
MGPRPRGSGQVYTTVSGAPLSTVPSVRLRTGARKRLTMILIGRNPAARSPRLMVSPQRLAVFTAVGGLCFSAQFGLLWTLARAGLGPVWVCNAIAFFLSTQLNCALSQRLTWKDRCPVSRRTFWRKLGPYNLIALLSLGLNTVGFLAAEQLTQSLLIAQAAGVVLGMGLTYLCCDNLLFREEGWANRNIG